MRFRPRLQVRHRDLNRALINCLMVGIHQLDQGLMRPGREALDNDRVAARVCPVPHGVIDGYMNVSNPGRYGKCSGPEHRHYVQIFRSILNKRNATRQRLGKG